MDRDDLSAKFWLTPVALARNFGFTAVELRKLQSLVEQHRHGLLEEWSEHFGIESCISVPLAWYPKLLRATEELRKNWKIAGGGYGIHWPDVDEDLSTEGLLRGAPAPQHSGRV